MITLLENTPAFKPTWTKCLGDLACYHMAIVVGRQDRETCASVARHWYYHTVDKNPNVGMIQHHLAVLAQSDMLPVLFIHKKPG